MLSAVSSFLLYRSLLCCCPQAQGAHGAQVHGVGQRVGGGVRRVNLRKAA